MLDGKGWWDISSSPPAAERNFRFPSLWVPRNLHEVYAWCLKLYMWSLLSGFSSLFWSTCGGVQVNDIRSGGNPLATWRTVWSKPRCCFIVFCINYDICRIIYSKRSSCSLMYLFFLCVRVILNAR